MKLIILFTALPVIFADTDYYKTANDNFDIGTVLHDTTLIQSFIDCFKNTGPCTEFANSYKVHISESVQEACKKCNPAQKHLFRTFAELLKEKYPEEYENFKRLYDPENKYFDALEKELSNY